MRGYKTIIREAELMAMPPMAVAEFLRRPAAQSFAEALNAPLNVDVEKALRGRGDPLVDLALAAHGRHMEVVSDLFHSAAPASPIRLACLSNRSLGHEIFRSFPIGLLGHEPGPMAEWLLSADNNELCALFENPTLNDSFLIDLLERGRGWESISDDKLCTIVAILQSNPRMRTPCEDDYMDGYAEYRYGAVFNAAWKLAETVPPTKDWSVALGWLYEQLQPDAFSIDKPLDLAARWHVAPEDAEEVERQAKDHKNGHLGDYERVRKGLARLALSKSGKLLPELLASEDVALRAAAYAAGDLDADQLRAGYEKDGELVFTEAIRNLLLWQTQATRQALHDIAWGVVRNNEYAVNEYNRMEKDVRAKHPDWFADEDGGQAADDDEVDGQSPATRADISALAGKLDFKAQGLNGITTAMKASTHLDLVAVILIAPHLNEIFAWIVAITFMAFGVYLRKRDL